MLTHKLAFICLGTLAFCLSLVSTASASTVWYTDGVHGNDLNNCRAAPTACRTIGHAISLALWGDSIHVAAATYSENLTINVSLSLIGASAATTIIDGAYAAKVVFIPNSSAIVALTNLTIRNGYGGGGGIRSAGTLSVTNCNINGNLAGGEGSTVAAGVYNSGNMTITNSTLSGNTGNGQFVEGGAIYNTGTLTINKSTLSKNTATATVFGGGGAIYNSGGTVTLINSTFSANTAHPSGGGGLYNGSGSVAINNSTFGGNTAQGGFGGGIYVKAGAKVTIQNSIVANSTAGGNCSGAMTSIGYNLSTDKTCTFNHVGDLINTNPKLGALASNGGPTQTMALPSGSLAIDKGNGNPGGCNDGKGHLLTTDQRGLPRHDKEDTLGCDIGAYESQTD
jgi:hypothetical protein